MEHLSTPAGFIALVLGFGFIVFVHELGHFLVAKFVGIKVTQFAIGMGPAICTWRKGLGFRMGSTEPAYRKAISDYLRAQGDNADREEHTEVMRVEEVANIETEEEALPWPQEKIAEAEQALGLSETEYRLNWLPIGGYVKMLGQEDLDPSATSNDPRSFSAKPAWARACVISAGVVMNLIFALIFFFFAFNTGVEFPKAVVGRVLPETPAAITYAQGHEDDPAYRGLRVGDHVTNIDGEDTMDFMDVRISAALASPGHTLDMKVQRPGVDELLTYRITPLMNEHTEFLTLGVEPAFSLTLAAGAAAGEGATAGMTLTAIDGKPVASFYDYASKIEANRGVPVEATFTDPKTGETVTETLAAVPALMPADDDERHLLGLMPAVFIAPATGGKTPSPAEAAGAKEGDIVAQIGTTPWPTRAQFAQQVLALGAKGDVKLKVMRDGETIDLKPITPDKNGRIGVRYGYEPAIIRQTLPGSPTGALRLNPGSRITTIDGQAVTDWASMQRLLQDAIAKHDSGEPIDVTFGYKLNIAGNPDGSAAITLAPETATQIATLAWTHPSLGFDMDKLLVKGDSFKGTMSLGFLKTHQFMLQTYVTLARLFQGTVKPKHLHGPVGIVHVGTRMAKQGWTYLLFFLGLISVNLVVINFLPIPIVDGGLMVFLIIEKLKGSPVSPRVMGAVNIAGLVMLGGIFLMVTYFDLTRLIP